MRTRKVGISIRERVDPISPAADEGRNKGVLLQWDAIELHTDRERGIEHPAERVRFAGG